MKILLIALDSVGIDPLGHNRPESIYGRSRFLFPREQSGPLLELPNSPVEGALVETDVTGGLERGAIECALTYTSHFTGQSAVARHGLMQNLGLSDRLLEQMIAESNLFTHFDDACLANAIFPAHLSCFGGSYVEDLVPAFTREQLEQQSRLRDRPLQLVGSEKHGVPELFTLAEINQNIFVHAAREAGVRLRTYDDVRRDRALTSSMTHELEAEFDIPLLDQEPLPARTPEQAAEVLVSLLDAHSFLFYKYQIPDLISHSGQIEKARAVFETIERFLATMLASIDAQQTFVIVTSDHGHLEQVDFHQGHPKTNVPTWCFGAQALERAGKLKTPEAIFHLITDLAAETATV